MILLQIKYFNEPLKGFQLQIKKKKRKKIGFK